MPKCLLKWSAHILVKLFLIVHVGKEMFFFPGLIGLEILES